MIETHLANTVLTNGARFYVDHAHPEYSSPECRTPIEGVRYDVAGEHVLRAAMQSARERGPGHGEIVVYKNNSDGKGNSYGCHENFLVDREVPFGDVVRAMVPHLVTRILYTGSGKVGAETPDHGRRGRRLPALAASRVHRGGRRPRDDAQAPDREHPRRAPRRSSALPQAAPHHRRRQHVPRRHLPQARYDRAAPRSARGPRRRRRSPRRPPIRSAPCTSCRATSTSLRSSNSPAADGASALDVQSMLYELAERYVRDGGGECVGSDDEANEILRRWSHALGALRIGPRAARNHRGLDREAPARRGLPCASRHRAERPTAPRARPAVPRPASRALPRIARGARGARHRVRGRDGDRRRRPTTPARTSEGRACAGSATQIVTANWDSLVFDLGTDPLRRVPMMDPLRGTAAHTEALLSRCETAAELLEELGT